MHVSLIFNSRMCLQNKKKDQKHRCKFSFDFTFNSSTLDCSVVIYNWAIYKQESWNGRLCLLTFFDTSKLCRAQLNNNTVPKNNISIVDFWTYCNCFCCFYMLLTCKYIVWWRKHTIWTHNKWMNKNYYKADATCMK